MATLSKGPCKPERPSRSLRSHARSDEKQFVFVLAVEGGFTIAETAELWEEPEQWCDSISYFFYPTVIGQEPLPTAKRIDAVVCASFFWAKNA